MSVHGVPPLSQRGVGGDFNSGSHAPAWEPSSLGAPAPRVGRWSVPRFAFPRWSVGTRKWLLTFAALYQEAVRE